MVDYSKLPLVDPQGDFRAVIETPKGSAVKYEFDPELGVFTVSKYLTLGLIYPFDFGFLPSTAGEDGDPLDVLMVSDGASFPGLVLSTRPIGVLKVLQTERDRTIRNDRLVVVPVKSERWADLRDVRALPEILLRECETFLRETDSLEDKSLTFQGWKGAKAARKTIEAGRTRTRRP